MSRIIFDRLVGPHGDTKELEFISAIHQTEDFKLRSDGTLKATDIVHYLTSRHGIIVDEKVVRDCIIGDLSGSLLNEDNEDSSIDLCQLITLLIIPYLVRLKQNITEHSNCHEQEMDSIFQIIVNDVRVIDKRAVFCKNNNTNDHKQDYDDQNHNNNATIHLTSKLLKRILDIYGEDDLSNTDIEAMLSELAKASGCTTSTGAEKEQVVVLDMNNFLNVLTHDIILYRPNWDTMTTTNYQDAMSNDIINDDINCDFSGSTAEEMQEQGVVAKKNSHMLDQGNMQAGETSYSNQSEKEDDDDDDDYENTPALKEIPTVSYLDRTADTYRSPVLVIFLWLSLVVFFHSYIWGSQHEFFEDMHCGEEFVCYLQQGVGKWLYLCALLCFVGIVFIGLSSCGNTNTDYNNISGNTQQLKYKVLLSFAVTTSIFVIVFFTILSSSEDWLMLYPYEGEEINLTLKISKYMLYLFVAIILLERCVRLIEIWWTGNSPFSIPYLTGGTIVMEQAIKQAATTKVNAMIKNALLMHYPTSTVIPLVDCKRKNSDNEYNNQSNSNTDYFTTNNIPYHCPQPLRNAVDSLHQDRNQAPLGHNIRAVLNYEAVHDITETVGGVFWTWKQLLLCFCSSNKSNHTKNSNFLTTEGIWLYARLLSCNMTQVLALLFNLVALFTIVSILTNVYTPGWIMNNIWTEFDYYADEVASNAIHIYDGRFSRSAEKPSNNNYTINNATIVNVTDASASFVSSDPSVSAFDSINNASNTIGPVLFFPSDVDSYDVSDAFAEEIGLPKQLILNFVMKLMGDLEFSIPSFGNGTYLLGEDMEYTIDGYFYVFSSGDMFFNASYNEPALFYNGTSYATYPIDGTFLYNETTKSFHYNRFDSDLYVDVVKAYFPKWELMTSVGIGSFFSLFSSVAIIMLYVPSAVSTVMKFRCGKIGSLRDPYFIPLRVAKDHSAILLGSCFWGCMFTGWFTFILFTLLAYFFLWTGSRLLSLYVVTQIIGITLTFLIRVFVLYFLRSNMSTGGFYRKKPGFMNLVIVCLECWNIALSVGFMAVRSLQLFVIIVIFIGRIDKPVLTPGTGDIGPFKFDLTPAIFKKDLLQHEAHRHPYIERLGLIYMMKLRHGDRFGTRIGAYWRLFLVLALMPWMQNYRTWARPTANEEEDYTDLKSVSKNEGEEGSQEISKITPLETSFRYNQMSKQHLGQALSQRRSMTTTKMELMLANISLVEENEKLFELLEQLVETLGGTEDKLQEQEQQQQQEQEAARQRKQNLHTRAKDIIIERSKDGTRRRHRYAQF